MLSYADKILIKNLCECRRILIKDFSIELENLMVRNATVML